MLLASGAGPQSHRPEPGWGRCPGLGTALSGGFNKGGGDPNLLGTPRDFFIITVSHVLPRELLPAPGRGF